MTRLMASLAAASPAGKDQTVNLDSPSKMIAAAVFVAAVVGVIKLISMIGKK